MPESHWNAIRRNAKIPSAKCFVERETNAGEYPTGVSTSTLGGSASVWPATPLLAATARVSPEGCSSRKLNSNYRCAGKRRGYKSVGRFQSFRVSKFQSFKVSGFQSFMVSRFEFRCIEVRVQVHKRKIKISS